MYRPSLNAVLAIALLILFVGVCMCIYTQLMLDAPSNVCCKAVQPGCSGSAMLFVLPCLQLTCIVYTYDADAACLMPVHDAP